MAGRIARPDACGQPDGHGAAPSVQSQRHAGATQLEGRDRELEALEALLAADAPTAIWVYGVAGGGKTALLRAFAHARPGTPSSAHCCARSRVLGAAGFGTVRRAAETPFNLVLEVRA